MAPSDSIPPTSGSPTSRQRKRYRYRLPAERKKRKSTPEAARMRPLIALGILLVALLITLVVIAFHLVPPAQLGE